MLTQDYFKGTFQKQISALSNVSVRVTLNSGISYWVISFKEAGDGYAVLEVYPDKGAAKFGEPQDHIVVPYECIMEVFLTKRSPDANRVYGFGKTQIVV